jgi:PhnB protein
LVRPGRQFDRVEEKSFAQRNNPKVLSATFLEQIVKGTIIYLHFDGNCRQAMTFYGQCLESEPHFTPFSAGPPEVLARAKDAPDRILHCELGLGPAVLMASDTMPGMPFQKGNNFSICLDCESEAEMEKVFSALSENGEITMPLHDAFWGGRFGMLIDQFGISWMFSFRAASQ